MNSVAARAEIVTRLTENLPYLQQHFHVDSLSIFGSASRDEMNETSDVDVLVEFGTTPGFIEYMQLKFFLESLLGRNVDLVTPRALKPRIRPQIEREAVHVT